MRRPRLGRRLRLHRRRLGERADVIEHGIVERAVELDPGVASFEPADMCVDGADRPDADGQKLTDVEPAHPVVDLAAALRQVVQHDVHRQAAARAIAAVDDQAVAFVPPVFHARQATT